jgi:spore maturation protein CgeB
MYRVYADAGLAVHVAGDEVRDFAGARRHFEIAGAGALLMTEAQPGLDRLFEPGREMVTFENADDCVDKVRYFLSHPAEAKRMARAGQARVLCDHSADALASRLEPVLQANLEKELNKQGNGNTRVMRR